MARFTDHNLRILPQAIERYLERLGYKGAKIQGIAPVGQDVQADLKGYGYGRPLKIDFDCCGISRTLALRTMSPDPFGHSRRSDRATQMLLSADTFPLIPKHLEAYDVGVFAQSGDLHSVAQGEFFLLTEYVEGVLYADLLAKNASSEEISDSALNRARALARYLARLHRKKEATGNYLRMARDTVGSGEGVFGQIDSFESNDPIATPERLKRLESYFLDWRWTLRKYQHRCSRTHGDFHPFNILFRDNDDFTLLDCSRGAAGEPADDVCCLSLNYLFFSLVASGQVGRGMLSLWRTFWDTYLQETLDEELFEVSAPFIAWRCLVLANPLWYPDLDDQCRDRILTLAQRCLETSRVEPDLIVDALAS
jgi:aminoglycoside phosphotransferase (APT) family kinase protein